MLDEQVDFSHQVFDVREGAATDRLLSDDTEPPFHEIEPGGISRREVQMKARPASKPSLDFGVFVGRVVVDDEMHVEVFGHVGIDMSQEGEELLMSVACLALGNDFTISDIECREQSGGAVTDIVVGDALDVAQSHGQHGLGPVESLNLAFLVDAQDHGVVRWIQVQADDVTHLLDEEGVIGELEAALTMRLHAEQLKPALHGTLRDAGMLGHRADAPVGPARRAGLQRLVDDLCHALVLNMSRPTAAQLFVQAFDAELPIPLPPFADRVLVQLQALGNGSTGLAIGTGQHDLGSTHQSVRQSARIREAHELHSFIVIEHDRGYRATTGHEHSPATGTLIIILYIYGTLH